MIGGGDEAMVKAVMEDVIPYRLVDRRRYKKFRGTNVCDQVDV